MRWLARIPSRHRLQYAQTKSFARLAVRVAQTFIGRVADDSHSNGQTYEEFTPADAMLLDTNGDGTLTNADDAYAPYYRALGA